MAKKKLDFKFVKHAHRRRFQEYIRAKGNNKTTIGYVYWNMYFRSGKGNVFELEESLFLADLGIGKNALRPARKTLVDDGWLSKAAQKIDPLTGKWGTTTWTVNTEPVALKEGVGTVALLAAARVADVGSTGDREQGDTVGIHLLGALNPNAHTSSCEPMAPTSSGLTNLPTDQSVAQDQEQDKPEESLSSQAKKEQPQNREARIEAREMPSGAWVSGADLLEHMGNCWSAFRLAKPTVAELEMFMEIMAKCDDNCCYPEDAMAFARTHIQPKEPKLWGAMQSVKGLHNAVCGERVSTTNGLLAQHKDHNRNAKECPICLKKAQGVKCKNPNGCKNWVTLDWNGNPSEYCAGCEKTVPAYP